MNGRKKMFKKYKQSKIPDGPYCHGKLIQRDDGLGCDKINPCPYWKNRKFHWWDLIWFLWRKRGYLNIYKGLYGADTYWDMLKKMHERENKYGVYVCKYIHYRDTYQGESLLWDECKSCGIKDDNYE